MLAWLGRQDVMDDVMEGAGAPTSEVLYDLLEVRITGGK
jgi:hypothetical protein